MGSTLRALIPVLCVVVFAAPICAKEIPDWPAPATWSPHAASRGVSTMGVITSPLPFIGVTPCRQYDSRDFTPLPQDTPREIVITGAPCGIPASAEAVSLNVTVFNILGQTGNAVFQVGTTSNPTTAWINYPVGQGQIDNAGVLPLTVSSSIFFRVQQGGGSIDFTVDVNGYYGSPSEDLANVFLGPFAGNTTMAGSGNTGIGFEALVSNTDGNFNTATGDDALANNNTGSFNTANGFAALLKNNGGSGNAAIGVSALFNNTIGFENIAVGHAAGLNLTTGDNNIEIGNPGVAGESDTIRVGTDGTQTRTFLAGVRGVTTGVNDAVAVMIDSAGQLGTVSSSRRFKQDIEDMGEASQGLMRLRPVRFRYKPELDPSGTLQYGLIAEEVAEVFPELVVYDRDGQPDTVRYHLLVPVLLEEAQKQRAAIGEQREQIRLLEARLVALEEQLGNGN